MRKKEKENNKKRNIILIVAGSILLIIILFLLWFLNRKFEVTFDYNNGTEEGKVLVKYNKTIESKDIKTKDDLGENFIDWYLVIEEKEGEDDVLSDEPFNFDTKIKENINLKAVYKAEEEPKEEPKTEEPKVEKVTIKFDSKGGSKVSSITINKGSALTFPKNPTRSGYTFKGWLDKNNKTVSNKTKFSSNATLYAKWEKNAEPKKEEPKKEESISLTLTNPVFTPAGTKKGSKAVATVKNASGKVTYSISGSTCIKIDSETGVIKVSANKLETCIKNGAEATVTATLPSGKSASKTVKLEKQLILTANGKECKAKVNNFEAKENTFTVIANQTVTKWETSGVKEITNKTVGRISGKGNADVSETSITAYTTAGQSIKVYFNPYVA